MIRFTRFILYFVSLVGFFCSCSTVKYVPVETKRTDTLYVNKESRDSIYVQDSILIHEKGDTVLVEKWKIKYVEKMLRDTCYRVRIDSVQVPYKVEKELTRWQNAKMQVGGFAIVLLIALCVLSAVWLFLKFKKWL